MSDIEVATFFTLLERVTSSVDELRLTIADEVGGLADYTLECGAYRRAVRLECIRALLRDKENFQALFTVSADSDGVILRRKIDRMEEILCGPHVTQFEPSRRQEERSSHA